MKKYDPIKIDPILILNDGIRSVSIFVIATVIAVFLFQRAWISDNIFGVYLLAVAIISATTTGYVWGILASFGGIFAINYFFTYPFLKLNFTMAGYPITFFILLCMSILTSTMTAKVRKEALLSFLREKRTNSANEMIRSLYSLQNEDEILDACAKYFYQANQCSVVLYLGSPLAAEKVKFHCKNESDETIFSSLLEKQIAQRAYEKKGIFGAASEKKDYNCLGTYLPILGDGMVFGVVGFLFPKPKWISEESLQFLLFMTSQLSFALERYRILSKAQQIQLETEKEKMRSNLLRAISHDLRTPLTCIVGASSTLQENHDLRNSADGDALLEQIQSDAKWLIRIVENLLSVTRLSSTSAKLAKKEEIVEEVVSEAVSRIQSRFPQAQVMVSVPQELLLVSMDATLIEQVIINLLENAIVHADSDQPLELSVKVEQEQALFMIRDHGKGVPASLLPHFFEGKDLMKKPDASRGLGIGLPICKSIIKAHGGTIYAENMPDGGLRVVFSLPISEEVFHA